METQLLQLSKEKAAVEKECDKWRGREEREKGTLEELQHNIDKVGVIGCINFVRLKFSLMMLILSKTYSCSFFFLYQKLSKTIRYGLRGSRTFKALRWCEQSCCSDFRIESNEIFVIGVGFFFRQVSTF